MTILFASRACKTCCSLGCATAVHEATARTIKATSAEMAVFMALSPCSVAAVKNEGISALSLYRRSQSERFSNDARVMRTFIHSMARGEHCRRWQNTTLRLNFGYLGSTLMRDSCPTVAC